MPYPVSQYQTNKVVWSIIGRLAFNRITVVGRQRLAVSGATLYVATHRNGALDAAPYNLAVPNAIPMVSTQLHRDLLGRFLFQGIPVARAKDRVRGIETDNSNAVNMCINILRNGGQLLIMPEGTSTLGPQHLPFQRGAARIAHAALSTGINLTLVPLAVHYEDPTVWQSRVEVLVGEPIQICPGDEIVGIHQTIVHGLESVGANFVSHEAQRDAEALAYASTLSTNASYAHSLKQLEHFRPETLAQMMEPVTAVTKRKHLCLHQGLPLVPIKAWPMYALYWLLLSPVVAGFFLLNFPVLLAGFIASRKLPDAPNVIAFWRMMVGLPMGLFWAMVVSALLIYGYGAIGNAVYWSFTLAGIGAWYRIRKLSIALCNGLFHPCVKPILLNAFHELKARMSHDRTV